MMDREHEAERPKDDRMERPGMDLVDYYFTEEGYLVFTERYHLKRGNCCGSGCRHCPFGHKAARKVSS